MTEDKVYLEILIDNQQYYILYGYTDFANLIKKNDFIYFKESKNNSRFCINVKKITRFYEIMNNCVEGGFDKMIFFRLYELDLELMNNEL